MSRLFGLYGELCAKHPWEVIVAVTTLTACFLTLDKQQPLLFISKKWIVTNGKCPGCHSDDISNNAGNAADVIVMTAIRCLAILYSYHQFRNLQKLGSKYILGIAGLLTVFSSFVFTSTVLNFLQIDLVDLKDALFFFLLLIDLSKAATLAQFALTASNQEDISKKIARGMSILGPTITLDTIVETLVIGVGTLSGVNRLEIVSYFAVFSVIVNYVIFMTFYPACLSLMLELGRISNFYGENQQSVTKMLVEENSKSNPAIQRVKVIMSIGLLLVHIHSRWTFSNDFVEDNLTANNKDSGYQKSDSFYTKLMRQFTLSMDHIVILILLITLMVKFIFFENREKLDEEIKREALRDLQLVESKKIRSRTVSFNKESQTDFVSTKKVDLTINNDNVRNLEDILQIYRSEAGASQLNDREVMLLIDTKHIPPYTLEKAVKNAERGVKIRRQLIESSINTKIENLPFLDYDYNRVMGACCENVIGYVPVPVGVAGPLKMNGRSYFIPMATTEGCLVASTNRGCRAVETVGIKADIVADGMSRAPVVRFTSTTMAKDAILWIKDNFDDLKTSFDSTSRFARLSKITTHIAGRYLYIRFVALTGDAMGMNMLSKGTEKALLLLQKKFPKMEILSLSGNVCSDKKPAAINWIEGRGKTVVAETIVPADVVSTVLKTSTQAMVNLNISKNFIGSAVAGSVGGFNAHAANIVTAIFIATGQDPAQNVSSSNCITIMEACGENNQDLYVSCTMPSIEIGTIGGGTILPAQSACLEMLDVKGAHESEPGENAKKQIGRAHV